MRSWPRDIRKAALFAAATIPFLAWPTCQVTLMRPPTPSAIFRSAGS
jgi:hypothetical protein